MLRWISTLALLCSSAGFATTVYKTVDENGVVGFSDTPPEGAVTAEILQIATREPQSPEEYLERLAATREATERLAADRREREKHRAELREIRASTASYQAPQQPVYSQYADYLPVYSGGYRRFGRPHHRPGFGPKPVHPITRPPLLPGQRMIRSSNSQLMRPLVSTRR